MSIVSLVIAPSIAGIHAKKIQENRIEKLNTMMMACKKAGCTEEECSKVMGTSGEKACCESGDSTSAACCTTDSANTTGNSTSSLKLTDGTTLNVTKGSLEEQLTTFFTAADFSSMTEEQLKTKWFDFNDVNFEMGSANLTATSKTQLDNLGAILKANPTIKMKIGGYTDKTGVEADNVKLSQQRALAIKDYLKSSQVLEAEGYGSQFATVDSTASNEERAVDRKMSIRLTK
jgi:outer membrane protein OmpA-like peptidoglycan-associated protein